MCCPKEKGIINGVPLQEKRTGKKTKRTREKSQTDQTYFWDSAGDADKASDTGGGEKADEPVTITVSAAGDCTLGTDEFFDWSDSLPAKYEEVGDPAYFFRNVQPIFAQDDLTIVNFEGTLTESEEREDKQFAFKAAPAYAEILTAGSVEAANMANNHSKDYGEQSYTDTIKALEDRGITTFGYDRLASALGAMLIRLI